MENIFDKDVCEKIISRINNLTVDSTPNWGSMNVAQMFAHCNVTYEMAFTNKHPKPNFFVKTMLKLFVKNSVVGTKPFPKNSRTAPQFIITNEKDFEKEKVRLIDFIHKTLELGKNHFEGKESHSFGALNSNEWNNMFYKHLNHHLEQFGV